MDGLLYNIAGVDASIMAETDARWRRKYRRSGLGMVFVALMCAVSGAYMFWVIFGSLLLAIPFSIVWAVVMQNLYRLVLVTVGNPHIPHAPQYRFPFGTFLFRSLFLIVLGLFIVKPMEILMLSGMIAPQLEAHRAQVIAEHDARINAFESENVQAVFSSGDLVRNRAGEGGYLMTRMQIMHRDFPAVWWLTAGLLWVFVWPFWSRVNWRRKSLYEQRRGDIEKQLVRESYLDFRRRFTDHMLALTGRDDIWEEHYYDMPFKNEPIVHEPENFLHSGSLYGWGRIFAQESRATRPEMNTGERHIYVVGDFFAKYWARRLPAGESGDPEEYVIHTYAHRVTRAAYVWDPPLPAPAPTNEMRPPELSEVELHFQEDPSGYGKPFFETLREPRVTDMRLEGVVKERKRSFGTIRGKLYVKVHTTVQ